MKAFKIYIIFILLISLSLTLSAQDVRRLTGNVNSLQIAEGLYNQQRYFEAINYYLQAREDKDNKKDYQLIFHLAESYRHCRMYEDAKSFYEIGVKGGIKKFPEAAFYLADMQQSTENYDKASQNFASFIAYPGASKDLVENAKTRKAACEFAAEQKINQVKSTPKSLPQTVNKAFPNYGAIVYNNVLWTIGTNEMLKFNEKVALANKLNGRYENYYLSRLYKSPKDASDQWMEREQVNIIFPEKDKIFNIAAPAFNADGSVLYYNVCIDNEGKSLCQIYSSAYKDNQLTEPIKSLSPLNLDNINTRHPSIAKIGEQQILFFTSDRGGSFGGYDIYYSILNNDGTFGKTENLGRVVNTIQDEYTPFYDVKNKTLYFSSKGHAGMGSFDIFKAEGDPFTGFKNVKNLGYPINTGADEYYYTHYVKDKKYQALITSNRKDQQLLNESSCCDNLYLFEFMPEQKNKFILKAQVKDPNTSEVLKNASIKIIDKKTKKVVKTLTNDTGADMLIDLDRNGEYALKVFRKDYDSLMINLIAPEEDTLAMTEIFLKKKELQKKAEPKRDTTTKDEEFQKMLLMEIYFSFNDYKLDAAERAKLDRMAKALTANFKDVILAIASHTDNVDTKMFNMTLSQKRSEAVVAYLTTKGVASSRLIAQWWGEESPTFNNQRSDGSDDPDSRKRNRRTDFTIVTDPTNIKRGQMAAITEDEDFKPSAQAQRSSYELDKETFDKIMAKYGNISKPDLVYKIQIGAYLKPEENAEARKKLFARLEQKFQVTIESELDQTFTKFLASNAESLREANDLKIKIRQDGSKNAFIVPYYKGKRINFVDAIEYLAK